MSENIERKKHEYSDVAVIKAVGEDTRKTLALLRVRVISKQGPVKYSKENPKMRLQFVKGHDLLQNTLFVKPFIMKLHKIEKEIHLDILLYLFPIQIFSVKDFNKLPLKRYRLTLKKVVDMGYLEKVIYKYKKQRQLYYLTKKAKLIVEDYYGYLAGEKTLSKQSVHNPFKGVPTTVEENQIEGLMLELKERSDKMPYLFKKDFS